MLHVVQEYFENQFEKFHWWNM